MKNIRLIFGVFVLALMVSSCASYKQTGPVMSVSSNSINTYVAADLDYNGAKRVEGIVDTKTVLGFIQLNRNGNKIFCNTNRYAGLSKGEKQALYRAKQNGNVDIILEPEFETEKHSWFFGFYKTKRISVKGWGINIKGVKEDTHGYPNRNDQLRSTGLFNK